ncbi:MAG: phosphatase PAP2 family protein [Acidobacteriota bacterium]
MLLAFCLTVLSIGYFLRLPASPPDLISGEELLRHYLCPLALAIVVHLVLLARSRSSRGSSGFILGVSIPTVIVATLCHFQFKAWMPLINPHRYGRVYENVDQQFGFIVALCTHFVAWMDRCGISVSDAYHGCFMILFFICFGLHALYDSPIGQRQLMLGVGCILAFGGICYWIAPAVGPFVYRHGADSHATFIQMHMWQKFQSLVSTRHMPAGYFLMSPAAMPSLHVAHTAFFLWMLRRISRPLSLLFLPVLLWFIATAIGLAWHYILDIPAGLLLAALAVLLVQRALPDPQDVISTETVSPEHAALEEPIPA